MENTKSKPETCGGVTCNMRIVGVDRWYGKFTVIEKFQTPSNEVEYCEERVSDPINTQDYEYVRAQKFMYGEWINVSDLVKHKGSYTLC